jgi:hypothetical protein
MRSGARNKLGIDFELGISSKTLPISARAALENLRRIRRREEQ